MNKILYGFLVLVSFFSVISVSYSNEDEFDEIILKTGNFQFSDSQQMINLIDSVTNAGEKFSFDDPQKYFTLAYERNFNELTVGAEFLYSDANVVSIYGTGTLNSYQGTLIVKKYFRLNKKINFFGGGGYGYHLNYFTTPDISSTGFIFEIMTGFVYRFDDFGIFLEYKYVSAKSEVNDWYSASIDFSGKGLFFGLSYKLGEN